MKVADLAFRVTVRRLKHACRAITFDKRLTPDMRQHLFSLSFGDHTIGSTARTMAKSVANSIQLGTHRPWDDRIQSMEDRVDHICLGMVESTLASFNSPYNGREEDEQCC